MKSNRFTCLISSLSLFRTRLPDPPSVSFTENSLLIAFDNIAHGRYCPAAHEWDGYNPGGAITTAPTDWDIIAPR